MIKTSYTKYINKRGCLAADVLACLKKARDNVKKGWVKGVYTTNGNNQFCAMGAVIYSGSESETRRAVTGLITKVKGTSIITWNDRPKTTKRMVLDFYRRIINKLEKELKEKGAI